MPCASTIGGPPATFQIRAKPSAPALTTRRPSAVEAHAEHRTAWPAARSRSAPPPDGTIATRPPSVPIASVLPSAAKSMLDAKSRLRRAITERAPPVGGADRDLAVVRGDGDAPAVGAEAHRRAPRRVAADLGDATSAAQVPDAHGAVAAGRRGEGAVRAGRDVEHEAVVRADDLRRPLREGRLAQRVLRLARCRCDAAPRARSRARARDRWR